VIPLKFEKHLCHEKNTESLDYHRTTWRWMFDDSLLNTIPARTDGRTHRGM